MEATGLEPPEIRLHEISNETPFELFRADKMGPGRRYYDTVAIKGTFDLQEGQLDLAMQQLPLEFADQVWNPEDAERSSLRVAGEVVLTKPNTDVLITGHVHAPGGAPLRAWDVAVEIRRGKEFVHIHRAHVIGPNRLAYFPSAGWAFTTPEPTSSVPIRYELAYGGAYRVETEEGEVWRAFESNPCGTGFIDLESAEEDLEYNGPQWYPDESWVDAAAANMPLAGLGPVPRQWPCRLRYAGTYDETWLEKARKGIAQGIPADYARDFDPRFFQCANPGLVMPGHLIGNEEIELTGVMPGDGPFRFQLPGIRVFALIMENGEEHREVCALDTVHIDVDAQIVTLTWRLTIAQRREVRAATFDLEAIL
jgi:hypothetical protein